MERIINYEQKRKKLLSDLGIKIEEFFRNSPETGNYIIKGGQRDKKVVIRIVPKSAVSKEKKMELEKIVSTVCHPENSSSKELVAEILSVGKNQTFIWSIRKYYPSRTLSDPEANLPGIFHCYDTIRPQFLGNSKKIIDLILKNLKSLQRKSQKFEKIAPEKQFRSKKYLRNFADFNSELLELATKLDMKFYQDFYTKYKKDYLSATNLLPCTGDLSPANVLINDEKNVIFFDLEYFCFDNLFLDIAYFWLFLWRYPEWQRELINQTIKNKQDKLFFRISIFRAVLSVYNEGLSFYQSTDSERLAKRLPLYQNHIWVRYLKAANKSFEAIMKVR